MPLKANARDKFARENNDCIIENYEAVLQETGKRIRSVDDLIKSDGDDQSQSESDDEDS